MTYPVTSGSSHQGAAAAAAPLDPTTEAAKRALASGCAHMVYGLMGGPRTQIEGIPALRDFEVGSKAMDTTHRAGKRAASPDGHGDYKRSRPNQLK